MLVTAVAAGMLAAPPAAQPTPLQAHFIGNMAVAITDGAFTLVTDFPYVSGAFGYMTYDPAAIRSDTAETLALITHRHDDHWAPALFAKTNWKVAGPREVTAGLPPDRVVTMAPRFAHGPLTIEAIDTPHAGIGHHSYVVTWHGRRLYFSGDTESADHLAALANLDAAFVSPWLYRAALRAGRIDAKRVIIYHHRADEAVTECGAGCIVPKPGDDLALW